MDNSWETEVRSIAESLRIIARCLQKIQDEGITIYVEEPNNSN